MRGPGQGIENLRIARSLLVPVAANGVSEGEHMGEEIGVGLVAPVGAASLSLPLELLGPLLPGIFYLLAAQDEADRATKCRAGQPGDGAHPDIAAHLRSVRQHNGAECRSGCGGVPWSGGSWSND